MGESVNEDIEEAVRTQNPFQLPNMEENGLFPKLTPVTATVGTVLLLRRHRRGKNTPLIFHFQTRNYERRSIRIPRSYLQERKPRRNCAGLYGQSSSCHRKEKDLSKTPSPHNSGILAS
jgi:hypothetical protein